MPNIPQAAVTAAAQAIERELMSGTSYGTFIESDEVLARAALEAAAPILAEQEVARCNRERDAIYHDLGQLLEALGLGDYARPESPHQVMLECIAEAGRLRRRVHIPAGLADG